MNINEEIKKIKTITNTRTIRLPYTITNNKNVTMFFRS